MIAECIAKSDWGAKDLARKENNLALLKGDEFYKGKTVLYDGERYKTYDNWLDFSIDFSDYIVFSGKYTKVLSQYNLEQQLDELNKIQDYSQSYSDTIETLIRMYGLWEFDKFY